MSGKLTKYIQQFSESTFARLLVLSKAGIAAGILLAMIQSEENPLEPFRWKNRVLLIFSNGSEPDYYTARQEEWLYKESEGIAERDIVVLKVLPETVFCADTILYREGAARILRQLTGIQSADFAVALVGKDGSLKSLKKEPVSAEELFALIDAMPMRKAELQQRNH